MAGKIWTINLMLQGKEIMFEILANEGDLCDGDAEMHTVGDGV